MKLLWNDFKKLLDVSEGDCILWYMIDVIFNDVPHDFTSYLDDLVCGFGFSPFQEEMGVSLYGDNDEDAMHPTVNIYQGEEVYAMPVDRFVAIISIAAKLYICNHPQAESTIISQLSKLHLWADEVVDGEK